jgi:DnaJ family protein A protein 2
MIRGQGMPSHRHHDFGNMYVQFMVKFPEKNWNADPEAFESLRKILPPPTLSVVPPTEAMTEPADLEDVDGSSSGARAFGVGPGGGPMDEDDEEGHGHGERVQCASQ